MALIKGSALTALQLRAVKRAFVHRNTLEHPYEPAGGSGTQTDMEWIWDRAFHFVADGSRLSARHRFAEPAFMADCERAA